MAYTYEDFTAAANKAGMTNRFSDADLGVASRNPEYGMSLLGLMQDAAGAKTTERRLLADEAANMLRRNYGVYSTGSGTNSAYASSYGSQIDDLTGKVNNYGSFQYGEQDAYQKLLDSIAQQQSFFYDQGSDPSYSAYKKQYLREGDRASANALAQASAASGGRVSSYAQNAAQQAGNYYAGQLSDMIPTLEQNAYQRYLNDFNTKLEQLATMQTDREFDYNNWMNEYNMLQNSLGNYQSQDETAYQRYLDQVNTELQRQQNEQAQAQQDYENALALYQTLGYATPEAAKTLGIGNSSAAAGTAGLTGGAVSGGGGSGNEDGGDGGDTGDGVDEQLAVWKEQYPSGKITSRTVWDRLVSQFGEDVLRANGMSYSAPRQTSGKTGGKPTVGQIRAIAHD